MVWVAEDDWAAAMGVEAVVVVAAVEGKVAGGLGVVAVEDREAGQLGLVAVEGTKAGQLGVAWSGAAAYSGHRVGSFAHCS